MEILLDANRGIYIPQAFGQTYDPEDWGMSPKDWDPLLAGPGHDLYWEAWDNVLANASYTDSKGHRWFLFQDGDLFAYREDEDLSEIFGI